MSTSFNPSKRKFVKGLIAGGVIMGLTPLTSRVWAGSSEASIGHVPVLSGTEFDLVIGESVVNFTGVERKATTINGSIPAPTLRMREGETVTIRVTNHLKESTSIHWHGIILPYQMDGVPGISFPGIAPGETFTYTYKVEQNGTYWYHSHSGMQEITGMYGAIIIDPAEEDPVKFDSEHTILLSDWTDENPMDVFNKLKVQGDFYNFNQPTVFDGVKQVVDQGLAATLNDKAMWNQMRMSSFDLADLSSETLTYLMNGTTPNGNWTGLFKRGERVRLRFINGASNSFYDVRIPGLKLQVVQCDGVNLEPVDVDEFRFGPGETYDCIVTPTHDVYSIFAQSMDRTGFASGTLATAAGLVAAIPAMDSPQPLTMADMMGDMGGMDHGQMSMSDLSDMSDMNHKGMNHKGMNHKSMEMPMMDHTGMSSVGEMDTLRKASTEVRHASTEYGPSVDMRVNTPRTNLDDPGVGLRNNGRRVLTLADLKTLNGPMDPRTADREIELHLTGNMERYTWSFDGLEFGQSTPVHLRYGERVRIILHNDTMMTHPMHLHGMWSELESPDGSFLVRRHTIPVQPAQRISFLVTADAVGRWAWHCHLMFHMDAGMFREVIVS
ncbi:copper resistance system multicopper oxidase [Litoribacillus peritrichatus]|uniref:Copper resistance system multicopper oxidase n=1 Tax=Litoribacillus peritrichatus TaxID=718191 RepID=A0ABP7MUQ6_9GAMM